MQEPRPKALGDDCLSVFREPVRQWFERTFDAPTRAQQLAWPGIHAGSSTLLLAPTGSGKTLAAFLVAIDRVMFETPREKRPSCRVLYVSPLKALAVDVERNLRAPLAGIEAVAAREGVDIHRPTIAIRSGDTPAAERARFARAPADILITTPESLFLMLTSKARSALASVDTVIVDEIHSLVPTKRGAHLFLSLERLAALRDAAAPPLQRIGLSATQRPLDEVARLLGGGTVEGEGSWTQRSVDVVDANERKPLELRVEVPVEDMARLGEVIDFPVGSTSMGPARRSIWPSIHPRLVELIRGHRSTMVFVNSRRLAERLAASLNETAEEEIALAHHGSIAREQRQGIEDRLKRGLLPAIVATSSLELGLDLGAVDLVIQIESPPSIASGMQRIGRARHEVGGVPRGVIFPKYRADLLACAAATAKMIEGKVEATFYPRSPLDVLAQQVVAIVAGGDIHIDALYDLVRRAAPFADLPRSSFQGVLDMLSGRYPSDEFAELRPRLTWDRVSGLLRGRAGAARIAVTNAGTIPDRGLYGVFLAGGETAKSRRVGELDEEMVFEARPGEVFVLGASSWRIEEITHDRVLVTPAPGEPGKMPFWHGDKPGRPVEFGRAVGELTRYLASASESEACERLTQTHRLDDLAAKNLYDYVREQAEATSEVPSERTLVIERYIDEIGDYRVCLLSPFGARVHAPWATAVIARCKEQFGSEVDMLWSDDGIVFRLPESEGPPDPQLFFPSPDEVEDLVVRNLGDTSLFAARFRENAARALLLPRKHPGKRSPLWAQRKRAADLLAVASRYGSFPMILETYRECLRDVFDLPGLVEILRDVQSRRIRIATVDSRIASPFASSLMFSYVANFMYEGDTPLAERRAQALEVDQSQLRELLGDEELRELLDPDAIADVERSLQRLGGKKVRHADGLHDLLLSLGDLSEAEILGRVESDFQPEIQAWLEQLGQERRIVRLPIGGEPRFVAAEDAARMRDALGTALPRGLPEAFLEPVEHPLRDLVSRYARTHGPFTASNLAARFGLGIAPVRSTLDELVRVEKVVIGAFLRGGDGLEWCDAEVLRSIKRRSLAKLRKEVEPVEPAVLARHLIEWQGIVRPRAGFDSLVGVIEQLQGTPLPASVLETEILSRRLRDYNPADLDALCATGEVLWRGVEPLGPKDGRIALYIADQYPLLARPVTPIDNPLATRIRESLEARGALFFSHLLSIVGGFPADLANALWDLVWAGEVTNDTLAPLRSLIHEKPSKERPSPRHVRRTHRPQLAGTEGRFSLLPSPSRAHSWPTSTEQRTATTAVLLERYGVLTREAVAAEGLPGGFSAVYEVLKRMEETARIRRGYFVAGLGATQFALPGADDRLRALREPPETPHHVFLSAADPANPYGAALRWPEHATGRPSRTAGAQVLLEDGRLLAFLGRGQKTILTFVPEDEPDRTHVLHSIASALSGLVGDGRRRALLITSIDGLDAGDTALGKVLLENGFVNSRQGVFKPRTPQRAASSFSTIDYEPL